MVLQGVEEDTLHLGAGHVPGTPLPGGDGNSAIAAHRVRFFASYKVSAPGTAFNSRLHKELPSTSYIRRRLLSRAIRGS